VTAVREFQHALLAQIQCVSDFAVSLHMAVVFLFPLAFPGSLIHISGRFVPRLIKSLEPFLSKKKVSVDTDLYSFLKTYQQKILVYLKTREGAISLEKDLQTFKDTLNRISDVKST
jgi:hypothetical protein